MFGRLGATFGMGKEKKAMGAPRPEDRVNAAFSGRQEKLDQAPAADKARGWVAQPQAVEQARAQVEEARSNPPADPFEAVDQAPQGTWSATAELQSARMEQQAEELNAAIDRAQAAGDSGLQKQA